MYNWLVIIVAAMIGGLFGFLLAALCAIAHDTDERIDRWLRK